MRHSKMRQLEFNQFGAAAVKPIFNDQLSVSMNISTLSDFFLRIFFNPLCHSFLLYRFSFCPGSVLLMHWSWGCMDVFVELELVVSTAC
jgi:hypothetical protein